MLDKVFVLVNPCSQGSVTLLKCNYILCSIVTTQLQDLKTAVSLFIMSESVCLH